MPAADGLPFDLGVDARHDAQQGGFPGAVQTQHAYLGPGKKEREMFLRI